MNMEGQINIGTQEAEGNPTRQEAIEAAEKRVEEMFVKKMEKRGVRFVNVADISERDF